MKPNILLILIDDLGWRDLACCGSGFHETPNLDMLASQSIRFTNASACAPVCSPTRASLLTGQYPATLGITDWIDWNGRTHPAKGRLIDAPYVNALPSSVNTIADTLRANGYTTWHVGKWHLGGRGHLPGEHGFDVNIGGGHYGAPPKGHFSPWGMPELDGPGIPDRTELTDHLTDRAIELIRTHNASPFFLNLCHYSVHTPIEGKPDLVLKYKARAKALGLDRITAFEEGDLFPCDHKRTKRIVRRLIQSDPAYAAMVENLDWNIGRILDALDQSGACKNTIVVFTSDNGGLSTAEGSPTCNLPLAEGKGWMYEGGTRVPLLIRWPGVVTPGTTNDTPVTTPDLFPTLMQATGSTPPATHRVDGESLMPLLTAEGGLTREAIFWHYPHYGNQGGTPGSSILCGKYKLIEFFEDDRVELYDLESDPGEKHDLSGQERDRAKRLQELLANWRQCVGARLPLRNAEWTPPNGVPSQQ